MKDWFYGAQACFPKAIEWHIWFDYWRDRYDQSQPIERWLVDATAKLQQTYIHMAQVVRKNDRWTRNYTGVEMQTILDTAEEARAWFHRTAPREDVLAALDPRLVFIAKALEGAYEVAFALAQELDQINRKGFVMVDVGAESRAVAQ